MEISFKSRSKVIITCLIAFSGLTIGYLIGWVDRVQLAFFWGIFTFPITFAIIDITKNWRLHRTPREVNKDHE